MPAGRYHTVLIDLDHTIFDFDASEREAFASTMALVGLTPTTELVETYTTLNSALWKAAERGEIRSSAIRNLRFERLAALTGIDQAPDSISALADAFVAGLGAFGELYPGARDVLEQLAERATLVLVSNGLGDVVRARVERLALSELFAAVVVSSEVGASKPHPAIFDAAFQRVGDPARHTAIMVGDSLTSDIAGGAAYGVATCWYNPHRAERPDAAPITHEIHDLAELVALVDGDTIAV